MDKQWTQVCVTAKNESSSILLLALVVKSKKTRASTHLDMDMTYHDRPHTNVSHYYFYVHSYRPQTTVTATDCQVNPPSESRPKWWPGDEKLSVYTNRRPYIACITFNRLHTQYIHEYNRFYNQCMSTFLTLNAQTTVTSSYINWSKIVKHIYISIWNIKWISLETLPNPSVWIRGLTEARNMSD